MPFSEDKNRGFMRAYNGVIARYRRYLPVTKKTPLITLQEGDTPLIHAKKISAILGSNFKVYLKYEGSNPTGSFKDRGMTAAITQATITDERVSVANLVEIKQEVLAARGNQPTLSALGGTLTISRASPLRNTRTSL